jgi:hypothetical protein
MAMIFTDTKDVFVSALFKNKKEGKKDGRFRLGAPTGAQFLSVYVLFFYLLVMFSKHTAFAFHMEDDGILPPFLLAAIFHS